MDQLHPFQRELREALADPSIRIVRVEAPVGAGKSKIVRDLVGESREHGRMLVLTYPTKILMEAQVGALCNDMREAGRDVCVWPDPDSHFRAGAINLVNYSTDALLCLLKRQGPGALEGKRGDLLHRLFHEQDWFGREKAVITTPDVLHLIATHRYGASKRLVQYLNAGATFVFDEFHLYYQLCNFRELLETILAEWNGRVVLLSATPIANEDVKCLFADYPTCCIAFAPDSIGDPANCPPDRVFNYDLQVRVDSFRTSDLEQWLSRLKRLLPTLKHPTAVIVDSVHRLQWLKRRLEPTATDLGLELIEWSGLHKDVAALTDRTIVMGTSAIEVGVNMNFRSLVMEATYWPSAVQRLGRVGRFEPGEVVIYSRRAFDPYLNDAAEWDRTEFEQAVLGQALLDPADAMIGGEMFRGDSYPFALIDAETRRPCFYDQSIFAMFDVEDEINDWRCLQSREKREILRDWRVRTDAADDILLRDQVFPFWGLLLGKLRTKYERVEYCRELADGLHVMAGQRYVFEKG